MMRRSGRAPRGEGRWAERVVEGLLALLLSPVGAGVVWSEDLDGNGIEDADEILLAERFRPVLVFPSGEEPFLKPCPVGILGDGGDLTADKLWARVYNIAGQLVGVFRTTDPEWNPAPVFASPTFNYSGFGWDQSAIPYVGAPPGAAYYIYYVHLYPDYGGPSVDCPTEWRSLYANGDGFHPPGSSFAATTYAHLFLVQGFPVIQYWFFFPYNDWVNNHEGDWEKVSIKLTSADPASAEILAAGFYFHGFCLERDASSLVVADRSHPIVWMGGQGEWSCWLCDGNDCPNDGNAGFGSHGCYPIYGSWEGVGADVPDCGRADEEVERCGNRIWWQDLGVVILPEPGAIDYDSLPGLSWHAAKIPFGTPFVPSYCDDNCQFALDFPVTEWLSHYDDCGNVSPDGPSCRDSWGLFCGGTTDGWYSGGPSPSDRPKTLRVPSSFSEIGEAARCALPGDTILVAPGTYGGNVVLPGGITTLSEAGAEGTVWEAPSLGRSVKIRDGSLGTTIGDTDQGFAFTRSEGAIFYPYEYVRLAEGGENILRGNRFVDYTLYRAVRIREGAGTTKLEANDFEFQPLAVQATAGPNQEILIGGSLEKANDFTGYPSTPVLDVACDSCNTILAEYNYWGSVDSAAIGTMIEGDADRVDFEPWTDSTHTLVLGANSASTPETPEAASIFRLEEAEPNPVSGDLTIRFRLPNEGRTTVRVYDARGRLAARVFEGLLPEGEHRRVIGKGKLGSGVYFIRVEWGEESRTRKIIVMN